MDIRFRNLGGYSFFYEGRFSHGSLRIFLCDPGSILVFDRVFHETNHIHSRKNLLFSGACMIPSEDLFEGFLELCISWFFD